MGEHLKIVAKNTHIVPANVIYYTMMPSNADQHRKLNDRLQPIVLHEAHLRRTTLTLTALTSNYIKLNPVSGGHHYQDVLLAQFSL